MPREIHNTHLPRSPTQITDELRRVLDDAATGIWRCRNAIARTTNYLGVAQRFLVEAGPRIRLKTHAVEKRSPASAAFAGELSSLHRWLSRVEARVDADRTDLDMEAAELDRLRVELRRASPITQSQEASE